MSTTDRLRTALADRYRIEREIGSGGMATVYLAEDLKHHRSVAVKVLRPDLAATMGPERFLREIEVAAQLTHPHIVPLHDSGEADGFLFYVMPYIQGESLRTKLQREGELPIAEALRILRDVVDALASAHRQGVVHRDIKPDNVLLSENHAVVTDFGVAKAVSEATGRQQLTTAGVALGTPAYMAPEQAAAEPHLDHRVDIYAVGAMAYELLTGSPPFTGNTAQQVLSAHVTQPPKPVTEKRESVPPALEQFVMRCLAKKPADRWQTTDEMLPHLEALATPSGGITPTTTRPLTGVTPRRQWQAPVIVGAIALVVALVGVIVFSGSDAVTALEFGRQQPVTLDPGLEVDPALSPDGRLMAYARGMPGQMRIYVRPISGGDPVLISERAPGKDHRYPRWSPDGTRILLWADGRLWTVPPLGGAAMNVVRGSARTGAWSPDGTALAYMESRATNAWALIVKDIETEEQREVVVGGDLHSPAWSPDGRLIAYVIGNANYWYARIMGNLGPTEVHVVPADGSSPGSAVTGSGHLHGSPTWMPDSRTLLLVSTRSGVLDVHSVTVNADGTPADSLRRATTGLGANTIQLTGDGTQLAYSVLTNTANAWYVDITGTPPTSVRDARQLTFGTEHVEGIGVSPDGEWIAYDSDRGGNVDIWKVPAGGGDPIQITTDPAADFLPAFSRDGNWIAFHSWRTGNRDLFLISADGSGEQQVTERPAMDLYPVWAPDGERIAFYSDASGRYEVHVTERAGASWSEPTQLTTGGGTWPDWSPSGTRIVYQAGTGVVRLVEVVSGRESVLLESFERDGAIYRPSYPRFTPDGRKIIVKGTDTDGFASFWDIPAAGGDPRLLVTFDDPSRPFGRPEFATDGRRIYFTIDNRQSDIWVMEVLQDR